MLTFELAETDKQSIKILLRRKNLRFLRRTNLIKTRCKTRILLARFTSNSILLRYTVLSYPSLLLWLLCLKESDDDTVLVKIF